MTEAEKKDIEAVRTYIAALEPDEPIGFEVGDAVRLDNGCLGVVWGIDPGEGAVYVCHIGEDGQVTGPSFGWRLEKLY